MDFSTLHHALAYLFPCLGRESDRLNKKNAKESVESSELGQQVNELKEALDEVKKEPLQDEQNFNEQPQPADSSGSNQAR